MDTVVMRETLERLEKLEAHLHEEKLRRAATEEQLKELKGLVDPTPPAAAAAAAPKPKRTASARAAAPKATETSATAVGGCSPVSAAVPPAAVSAAAPPAAVSASASLAAVQRPKARFNSSRSGRPATGSVAEQLDDPFSRSWLRR